MNGDIKEILVICKTHLDLGFTNFAETIRQKYLNEYIPNAIKVAEGLAKRDIEEGFVWTLGSWMIKEYLDNMDAKSCAKMEEAINKGWISWHALPFTTHTELMDAELFQHGLSISKELDIRFGKRTTAAKFTDVPGHTIACVPFLANAGVEFLHIGVNDACTYPNKHEAFRWRARTGQELVVMYQPAYGSFTELGDTGIALHFAHTGDNMGPQSEDDIIKEYDKLKMLHPTAKIRAASLNDVAEIVASYKNTLPVITEEFGDTWIHGAGSDPKKMSQYRALLRFRNTLLGTDRAVCNKMLLPIPEHTWGLDEKTFLHDYENFVKVDFSNARKQENYQKMQASWAEQREYITKCICALYDKASREAEKVVSEYCKPAVNFALYNKVDVDQIFSVNGFKFSFNKHGAIDYLLKGDTIFADSCHRWGKFIYEAFSKQEYDRFKAQYMTIPFDWAIEDLGKIGIESAISEYYSPEISLAAVYQKGNEFLLVLDADKKANELYGCPEQLEVSWIFEQDCIQADLCWRGKPATRVAEAMWFGIDPMADNLRISKLGEEIAPMNVIEKGARNLHGFDYGVRYDSMKIHSLDAGLVCPGAPSLLNFTNQQPELSQGVHFNLYNNVWGTNFPMWYDEDARFRFVVEFD